MVANNYENMFLKKDVSVVNLSPKSIKPMKRSKRQLKKHSQSLPQLRGLLEKFKKSDLELEANSLLKGGQLKIDDILPSLKC
jgi:hypothetical protein